MASCNNGLGSILEKNFPLKKDRFFAVFDGMGGGEYGEIASYMGAKATEEYLNAEEADDIAVYGIFIKRKPHQYQAI